jgi:hypothetical protein
VVAWVAMIGLMHANPATLYTSAYPVRVPKCVELRVSSLQGASRQQSLARSQGELVETEVGKQGAA